MKIFTEIGLNHLVDSKLAIDIVKKCVKCDIDGITLQIQQDSYYDNSKNFRRAIDIKTYQKISTIVKKSKNAAVLDEESGLTNAFDEVQNG